MPELRKSIFNPEQPGIDLSSREFQYVQEGSGCHFCRSCDPDPNFIERPPEATLSLWENLGCPGDFDKFDEHLEDMWSEEPGKGAMFGRAKSGHYIFMCSPHFERAHLLDQLEPNTVTLASTAVEKFSGPWTEQFMSEVLNITRGEEKA